MWDGLKYLFGEIIGNLLQYLSIKKQRHHFANKVLYSQGYGFSSSHVRMWELNHKKVWAPKNWCSRTVVSQSPFDSEEIKPVNPKGNQPWIITGRTSSEAEAPILWSRNVKSQLIGKDSEAGKDWRQEEKGTAGGEGDDRGWDGWMALLTQQTCVWANSGR